jgi:cell filamentation protein
MYEATEDPYCYPGTTVLKNRLDLRTQAELDEFEAFITTQRADEPLAAGLFDETHYRAVHRHLFADVYDWAGEFRSVRIAKGDSMFCYPENIGREMERLFASLQQERCLRDLDGPTFAERAAHFLAELNAIHPFRDGNGRAQLAFMRLLAKQAGHPIDFTRLDPAAMMQAMIASFGGNEAPLADVVLRLTHPR